MVDEVVVNSGKAYEVIDRLATGDPVYIDRGKIDFVEVGPYAGATYIRTAFDDARISDPMFLSFRVKAASTVYVAYNAEATEIPAWLMQWTKLTDEIVTTVKRYSIYYKIFPAGMVHLGGELPEKGPGTRTMYFVIVKPGEQPENERKIIPVTHTLKLETFGEGQIELNPPGGVYARHTEVKLTAKPGKGWEFYRWVGDLNADQDSMTLTVRSYYDATAIFYKKGLPGMGVARSHRQPKMNKLGMRMMPIEAGEFVLGDEASSHLAEKWDEGPPHKVKISKPFEISETEVTIAQYKQFDPDYDVDPDDEESPIYVTGISWDDAMAFCRWLSEQEGVTYRLPTEAEWEYACKAGSDTPYWFDEQRIAPDEPNAWGIKNMLSGALEWCYDWYGAYGTEAEEDPLGMETGIARVVRGGGFYGNGAFPIWPKGLSYARPTNRGGYAPNFKHEHGNINRFGRHPIGFRVVRGDWPGGQRKRTESPYVQRGIKQTVVNKNEGPDPNQPYFRKRYMLPTPPENRPAEEMEACGIHPAIYGHNHSPGLAVLDNGDLLAAFFSAYHERTPGVGIIATRLRYGADEWDMPSPLLDFPDVNDHAPLLWNDAGKLYLFWGHPKLDYVYPFQWIESDDHGATWSEVKFPYFPDQARGGAKQPINSAFRDANGTMYVASDMVGATSVLYKSKDNGETWIDPGGSTKGRHTSFALLSDGKTILGLGGKGTHIDGYMPQSISTDGGRTWQYSKTPFNKMDSRQRPTIIRLQSGRLFMAGDFENKTLIQPPGVSGKGCFVALSEDDGETWQMKTLPGAQLYEGTGREMYTLGYTVAQQAANGIIHLITTTNKPCLHFELNEAWILQAEEPDSETQAWQFADDAALMSNTATQVSKIRTYEEKQAAGKRTVTYSIGQADDGRMLLHGPETWVDEHGQLQRKVNYKLGKKIGTESYYRSDGTVDWTWQHDPEGVSVWTTYWPNGRKKTESTWRDMHADGDALRWDLSGKQTHRVRFVRGEMMD